MLAPATRVPRSIVVPGLIMALEFPFSILTGLTTFHLPLANFWNEPHGALSVCAYAAHQTISEEVRTAALDKHLIIVTLALTY